MNNPAPKGLNGLTVVSFESRLSKTMGDLIALNGGIPVLAPSMKEVPLENNSEAFHFAEKLGLGGSSEKKVDAIIFLTGVGTKALVATLETRYKKEDIIAAFKKVIIVARGPKPVRALNELGIPIHITAPEPNTWREILSSIDENKKSYPLENRTVAIQEYGEPNEDLMEGLKDRGVEVLRVPIYRWTLPDDLEPLKKAIRLLVEGRADVVFFTTAVQAHHVFRIAQEMGVEYALLRAFNRVVLASVGPDCSQALLSYGLKPDVEPESPKMGPLVKETAEKAAAILNGKRNGSCAAQVRDAVLDLMSEDPLRDSLFMKACRREKTSHTPIWLMRQAGRYMKDYREIREKNTFLGICKNKDLVTEITVHAQKKLSADAAIIFSDILVIVEPLGLGLDYVQGDGPSIQKPLRSLEDIKKLLNPDIQNSLSYVFQAIQQTRSALPPNVPLLGFAGAPFTLASYMIEGGGTKDFTQTKKLMRSKEAWNLLMEKISKATSEYLAEQIKSGVQAVQLFDSWAGYLTKEEYETFALPYSRQVIESVKGKAPLIHFGTGTAGFLESLCDAGGDVIGVDHHVRLDEAWKRIGYDRAIQGNLDPKILCGSLEDVRREAKKIVKYAAGRPGHIFNLGHGVLPETPVENAVALVDMIHEMSAQ